MIIGIRHIFITLFFLFVIFSFSFLALKELCFLKKGLSPKELQINIVDHSLRFVTFASCKYVFEKIVGIIGVIMIKMDLGGGVMWDNW